MPVAPWEDLDVFLDPIAGFAVRVQISPTSGPSRNLNIVFDEAGVDATLGAQFSRADTSPRMWGKEIDLAGLRRGDAITMGHRTFDVMEAPEPDGTGWASVRVSAQPGSGGR